LFPLSDPYLVRLRRPYVNVAIIVVCAAVFVYELMLGGIDRQLFFYRFGLIPSELAQGASYDLIATPLGRMDISTPISNWITLATSLFIHGSWMHFLGNMLFLWVFGDNIEDRFGHFRYLVFYLAAGAAASWLQIAVDTSSQVPTIGASGAIAGVLGAYILLYPFSRIRTAVLFFFITIVRVPALYLLGFWIILQFFSGVGSLGVSSQSGGVAYWAHIGGFIFGLLVVVLYKRLTGQRIWPRRQPPVQYWRGRPL
jgi:membrane associated rhomboid family serine protease